ncbi:hypothetical protein OU675_24815, partial [Escherichia coli]|nr:hypothetical protein [Escherichia coli]MDF9081533.1 hypothetical protein [Escherichia coli]
MKRYTHDLETDLNDVDKTPSLIHKTLLTASTIYDLKYLAQVLNDENGHCCKVSDEAAFCLIQRPYISKTLLT